MDKKRLIFAGTPEFAARHLTGLIEAGFEICAVFTQPDAKVGRGRKTQPTPVKAIAVANDIPVYQPLSLKENQEMQALIESLKPDFMVVVAYGLMIPQSVLDAPLHGCLNVHGSILPRWRGAAPVQRAIEAQDEITGICIMQMDAGLDTGPVRHKKTIEIANKNSEQLLAVLAELGLEALIDVLNNPEQFKPLPQATQGVSYAHKLHKSEKFCSFTGSASAIDAKVRALTPWPGVVVKTQTQEFKLLKVHVVDQGVVIAPGTITSISQKGMEISCGQGEERLLVERLQIPGSKPCDVQSFINGKPDYFKVGQCFSEGLVDGVEEKAAQG